MRVTIATLWIRRKGDEYDEAPELAEAWTEFDIENWPDGWEQAKTKVQFTYGDQFRDMREIDITLNYEDIRDAFLPVGVTGHVASSRTENP